jgi:hypothetical protein
LIEHVEEFQKYSSDENNDDEVEKGALENLKRTISDFKEHVSTRITHLDEKSQSLIQIVSTPILSNLSYQLR